MVPVDWTTFMGEYEEGLRTLGSDNWIDVQTGEVGWGETPTEDPRYVHFFASSHPERPVERSGCWRGHALLHRWDLMVYARYPAELRLRLEDAYFDTLPTLDWFDLPAGELRALRKTRKVAYRETLRSAPGAEETLERWRELSSMHALAKWCAEVPLGLQPPPFAEQALTWREEMEREEAGYRMGLIERLDLWLRTNAPAVHDSLAPGLSEAELDAAEGRFGATLSPGLRALYRWRNGSSSRGDFYLNYSFASVESAERVRAMMLGLRDREGLLSRRGREPPKLWSDLWLPVFDRGNGDLLCFDAVGADDGIPGRLVDFPHEVPEECRPAFEDVESWLETYVGALERGLFAFDGDYLECLDLERFRAFARPRV